MKITKVEASCHKVPIELPLGKPFPQAVVVVRVETDEGITGVGIARGSGLTRVRIESTIRDFINRQLAPFVVGKNPLETERLWNRDAPAELGISSNMLPTSEMVRWGFSAIDIALWDIKGKHFNQPVFRLLGGNSNRIPAYVTFGFAMYNREELAQVARQFVQMGQNNLKMVVGYTAGPNMAEEEARVRAVREAMGDEGMLMIDGNARFNFVQAREFAKRVEPYHISWFEAPLADLRMMPALRQWTTIPLGTSGGLPARRWRYRDLILDGAVDIIQPNVLQVGGYTEALKIAHLAQAFSMPVATGGGEPHHNMHLIAGVANGWIVEFHYGHTLRNEVIFVDPPRFDHGWVTLPEKPGLGFEPNEAALKEFQES